MELIELTVDPSEILKNIGPDILNSYNKNEELPKEFNLQLRVNTTEVLDSISEYTIANYCEDNNLIDYSEHLDDIDEDIIIDYCDMNDLMKDDTSVNNMSIAEVIKSICKKIQWEHPQLCLKEDYKNFINDIIEYEM